MRCWPLLLTLTMMGCDDTSDKGADGDTDVPADTDTDTDADTDTDTDTDTDADTDTPLPCTATVVSVEPENNGEAQPDQAITAHFDVAINANDHWSIDVTQTATAAVVPGTSALAPDGLSATFTPTDDLVWSAGYDMSFEVCSDAIAGSFTVVPEPIDPVTIVDRSYGIPYGDIVWTEPGDTSLLDVNFDYILVQVRDVDLYLETIDAIAGTGYQGATITPECTGIIDPPAADFSTNPRFAIGPMDLSYPYNYSNIVIEDFLLLGQFLPDSSAIVDVRISGLFDPEQLLPVVPCALAAAVVQGTCAPCNAPSGSCIVMAAEVAQADWLPTLDIIGTCGL